MTYRTSWFPNHSSGAEMFANIVQGMLNSGWTIYDDIGATEKVFTNDSGESGHRASIYIHLTYTSYLYYQQYLYWNNATHVGSITTSNYHNYLNLTSASYTDTGTYKVIIWGDKDGVMISTGISLIGSIYTFSSDNRFNLYFGYIDHFKNSQTSIQAAATVGTNVNIEVSDSSEFRPGNKVMIVDSNTTKEGRWPVIINSIPDSTHLELVELSTNISVDSKIGTNVCNFVCRSPEYYNSSYPDRFIEINNRFIYSGNTGDVVYTNYSTYGSPYNSDYIDPDTFTTKHGIQPMCLYFNRNGYAGISGFFNNVGSAPGGDVGSIFAGSFDKPKETMIITDITPTTITDSSKNWPIDSLIDEILIVSNGNGANQTRKILSNTSDTITYSTIFDNTPLVNDVCYIVTEVYRGFGKNGFAVKEIVY